MKFQLRRPLIVFDIESTGVDPGSDRIVELGWIKVHPDGKEEEKVMRINPGMPIPIEASEVHGIYDQDVADCPTFLEVADAIWEEFGESDIAGFNSNHFDIPLLAEELLRAGKEFDLKNKVVIDAFQVFVKKEKRDLSAAYQFYCNKTLENAHSAIVDVRATLEVIKAQSVKYSEFEGKAENMYEKERIDNMIDFAQRFVKHKGKWTVNFGKHKGKSMQEVHRNEPKYFNWMLDNEFPEHTKQKIREFLMMYKLGQNV